MKIKKSKADILADILIYALIAALSIICLIPFIHVAAMSISSDASVYANKVWLIPKDITLNAYKTVLGDPSMMHSLGYTVIITALFTALGMFLTICAAYALSRKRLKGRKVFNIMFLITMYYTRISQVAEQAQLFIKQVKVAHKYVIGDNACRKIHCYKKHNIEYFPATCDIRV